MRGEDRRRSLKDDRKLGHAEMSCDGKDVKDLN